MEIIINNLNHILHNAKTAEHISSVFVHLRVKYKLSVSFLVPA